VVVCVVEVVEVCDVALELDEELFEVGALEEAITGGAVVRAAVTAGVVAVLAVDPLPPKKTPLTTAFGPLLALIVNRTWPDTCQIM
jgi:hypothetical protein